MAHAIIFDRKKNHLRLTGNLDNFILIDSFIKLDDISQNDFQ